MSRLRFTSPCVLAVACSLASLLVVRADSDEPETANSQQIVRLIAELGDEQYSVRQRAQQAIKKLGVEAFDALGEAENDPDPEIASQAAYLRRLIEIDWATEDDSEAVRQILSNYNQQTDEHRQERIRQLADLPADEGLAALCRLARFATSSALSKYAALGIMAGGQNLDATEAAGRAALVAQAMEGSRRPVARWLQTYLTVPTDPNAPLAALDEIIETEKRSLEQHPQETSGQIVMELLKRKVSLLDRFGRTEQVDDVLDEMIACERGEVASLGDFVDWLRARKAYSAIDKVAERFEASFEVDPILLYALAEARAEQGRDGEAGKLAEQARRINGNLSFEHWDTALVLSQRGLARGVENELRAVLEIEPYVSKLAELSRNMLMEVLHDHERDTEAAAVVKRVVDAMEADPKIRQQINDMAQARNNEQTAALEATMHFYEACAAARQDKPELERELLAKAFEKNPGDIQVLIAVYQRGDPERPRRRAVVEAIDELADEYRAMGEESSDPEYVAMWSNQFAWLIANTEGDFDEALRRSTKSIEISRSAAVDVAGWRKVAGYLDTLAHCYYAKGDYASAVRVQTEAVRLDPHTQSIQRQFKVFKDALAREQAEQPSSNS